MRFSAASFMTFVARPSSAPLVCTTMSVNYPAQQSQYFSGGSHAPDERYEPINQTGDCAGHKDGPEFQREGEMPEISLPKPGQEGRDPAREHRRRRQDQQRIDKLG